MNRFFHLVASGTFLAGMSGLGGAVTYLDQGWPPDIRQSFYYTPQGSHIIPAAWFPALRSLTGERFATRDRLKRFGFIYDDQDHNLNPYRLPIGFAIEPVGSDQAQLGLTCAACHTANIEVGSKEIRIDGGQANLDLDWFYQGLAAAVTFTLRDEEAFLAFAEDVLDEPTQDEIARLKAQLTTYEVRLVGDAQIRRATTLSGFGRVDALTQIVNAMSVIQQRNPNNLRPLVAPTSYPFLWLSSKLEFVQWNPIASSPIARNGGQVLGVFGNADLHSVDPSARFRSTLLIENLFALEQWVDKLTPPTWDEGIFGEINSAKAAQGQQLYEAHCQGCHSARPYRMTDPSQNYRGLTFIRITSVDYKEVGTDSAYVEDLVSRSVETQIGAPDGGYVTLPALQFFLGSVGPVVSRAMDEAGLSSEKRQAMSGFRFRPAVGSNPPEVYRPASFTSLKAGPLPGVWATGPFLHNGSVASIYELLSPVEERRAAFFVGGRQLDTQKLGFVSENAPGRFRFDTRIRGNGNAGHEYPKQPLSEVERFAIVEYLKTLD